MKIGVYQICKNEQKYIYKWYNNIKDEVDGIFVTDTGSTDGSLELLKTCNKITLFECQVSPWRFDLQRNMQLLNVPEDYDVLLSLDMDEVMVQGWRQEIEKNWNSDLDFLRYKYVYTWVDEKQTIPRISMYNFKIHRRHGCKWVYPVHEVLEYKQRGIPLEKTFKDVDTIQCYHYPDLAKQRPYFDLLKLGIEEYPDDFRNYWLLQREYLIYKEYDKCIEQSKDYLQKSYKTQYDTSENLYRQEAMRYIQESLIYKNNEEELKKYNMAEPIDWFLKSVQEDPYSRESWGYLQKQYGSIGNFHLSYQCQKQCLSIPEDHKKFSIHNDETFWGDYPKKMLSFQLEKIKVEEKI